MAGADGHVGGRNHCTCGCMLRLLLHVPHAASEGHSPVQEREVGLNVQQMDFCIASRTFLSAFTLYQSTEYLERIFGALLSWLNYKRQHSFIRLRNSYVPCAHLPSVIGPENRAIDPGALPSQQLLHSLGGRAVTSFAPAVRRSTVGFDRK